VRQSLASGQNRTTLSELYPASFIAGFESPAASSYSQTTTP
jgi:hypothetical protein